MVRASRLCAVLCAAACVTSALAQRAPRHFDALASAPARTVAAPAIAADPAASGLVLPGSTVQREPRFGVPTFVWAAPAQRASLRGAPEGAVQAATAHLARFAPMYGLSAGDVAHAAPEIVHDRGTGPVIVSFKQQIDGVDVFRERVRLVMDRRLDLVALSGFISPVPSAANGLAPAPAFALGAADAAALALSDLRGVAVSAADLVGAAPGNGGYAQWTMAPGRLVATGLALPRPIRSRKTYFHLPGAYVPAYYVEVEAGAAGAAAEFYAYVVSAVDGSVLFRHDLVADDQVSWRVWADGSTARVPSDGPIGDGWSPSPSGVPDHANPPMVPSTLVTLQNGPIGTNDPWLAPGATLLTGNNVEAYADLDGTDGYTAGDVHGALSGPGAADYAYDVDLPAGANATQRQATMVQLFYTLNWLHDWFYDAGFDERAGNAQASNYGRGGVEGDALHAEAQDSSGTNNSNMSTPADGGSPRLQSYVFTTKGPWSATVTAPSSIAGRKPSGTADFGAQAFSVTQSVVRPVPADGCTAFGNAGAVLGQIVLIDRGTCTFAAKLDNAYAAGAAGAIIGGVSSSPAGVTNMSGTSSAKIGALYIVYADAQPIRNLLASGQPVTATIERAYAPYRDGGLDNTIVAHEWGHYISNRLVGNSSGLSNNLGRGLGEGWGDFHALLMSVRPEDASAPGNANWSAAYPIAVYATAGGADGGWNNAAYFGIRRVPYSTDFAKDPLTYRHITNGVALPTTAPLAFGADGSNNAEVHNTGEVWATMLWECYASLLRDTPRLTFAEAQQRMKVYLVQAYELTPTAPTLLEARDALLAAAAANDPRDYALFLQAFARRGAGQGAVSPDRYSTTNAGAVESYAAAAAIAFDSADLAENVTFCDGDGVLDSGETGTVVVTLRNTGPVALTATTATLSTALPGATFPAGTAMSFPASEPGQTTKASLPIALAGLSGVQRLDVQVTYTDDAVGGSQSATASFRVNADEVANASATDDAESESDPMRPADAPVMWARVAQDVLAHAWHGPDPGARNDAALVTPPLQVAPSGSFSFTFRHRWAFEADSTYWDGGVIEISTDGGATWSDIGSSASPGYNGTITASGGNVLAGRPAFVGTSSGSPAYVTTTVSLGTAYAGRTVQVRFRIGADEAVGAAGWDVDDIAFSNVTNTPFPVVVGDRAICDADGDGQGAQTDCAPADPTVWAIPSDTTSLRVGGQGGTTLTWSAPDRPGTTATVHWDLLASDTPTFGSAWCVLNDTTMTSVHDDAASGPIRYWLVLPRNACGIDTGTRSDGTPREPALCP